MSTVPLLVFELLGRTKQAADCSRRKVGAVLTSPTGGIVSAGWNGLRDGSCRSGDCLRGKLSYEELPEFSDYTNNCKAVHAEQSAIDGAGKTDIAGFTLWVTCEPCPGCTDLIKKHDLIFKVVDMKGSPA